ncbi:MAG: hypothetical protein IPK03_08220 [Bacteroidetes bacterium]|nr:hypothetical protein [Bacteroidota bacterium]
MVKNLHHIAVMLFLIAGINFAEAQPGTPSFISAASTATGNAFPLNSTTSNKVQWIYAPGVFSTSGGGAGTPVSSGNNITKVYIRIQTVNTTNSYTGFTISMGQNVGTSGSYGTATASGVAFNTGLTSVYAPSGSVVLTGATTGCWYGFTLTTPFLYDPTKGLVIEVKANQAVSGGNSVNNISTTGNMQRLYAGYSATTGTINTGLTPIGIDVTPNAACTAPPTAGTNVISPLTGLCAGGNLSLNLTGNSTGSGQTYVWKRSSTLGGTYTAISGVLTSPAFNYSPSDSGYYRCTLFCSGDSSTTAATKVNVVAPFPAGTYTINSAVATGGTNYQTFTAAVNALACGIAGPVVFNVVPGSGPYNEQFSIPSLIGSSSTNTVTFNGNGDTITSAGSAGYWGTIDLNGADYVRIKNLNIFATAATNAFGIRMGGGADNNIIDSCNIYVLPTATGSTVIGVVISGSPILYSTAGPNGKNNEIRNCSINGGYIGVSLYGESASNINNQNNNVRNCRITDYYIYGVYNIYQGNSFISNNIISRPTRTGSTTTYGVMLTTGCSNITVERNRIRNLFTSFPASTSTCYPFYCILTTAGAGNENRFINNVISDIVHAGPIYAIYLSSGNFIKAYNNTIVLDDATATTTSPTYGIYSASTTAANLDFRNNSIHISRGGAGTKACVYYRSALITSDNNNLYMASTAGTNNIGDNSTLYSSLATWQTANGGTWDANSVSANPLYSNAAVYNYIPTTTALNNAAASIPSLVSIDIDSVVRSVTPDIGAHEFTVGTLDAKIDWVSPMGAQTAGNKNVRAKITNMSVDPITSLVVNYTDGTNVYTDTLPSVAMLTGDTLIVNFTNLYNLTTAVSLRGFITSVNGMSDFVRGNDTSAWQNVCIAMAAGTYTINSALPDTGSNFSTFNNAVTAMSCGIVGPVIFNVAPGSGPYAEQVDIPAIPGSSSVNTVTINGNNNELIFAGGNGSNFATLNLNGTRHLRINNLNITGTALTNCYGIHLMGNAAFNTFDSCTVAVSTTAAVTSVMGVSISASKTSYTTQGINANNNLFNRCTITGGYYAMVFYGYSTLDTNNRNNSVTNCIVRDAYSYGIYNIYQGYSMISNNVIERPTRASTTTTAGVFLTTNCVNILVEKNRIRNLFGAITGSTSTAYGIYCSSSAGSSGLENKFINNIISDIKSNGAIYAIYPVGSTYVQIYHNTINLDDQTATAGTTYGIYSTAATATGVDIKNNIVNITRGGTGTKYCIFLTGLIATSDNNDLYINSPAGTNAVGFNVSAYTTLADWQAANGSIWDQSSVGLQPNFLSIGTNNFKPTNPLLDNLGTNVGIATDIVGNSRSVSTPDIGAYEIIPIPIDLGALSISSTNPGFNGCYDTAQTISVLVQNLGIDTLRFNLTPATVTCYISGAIMDTVVGNITDSLLPGATKLVTITAGVNMSALGTYTLIAKTNIAGDGDILNDIMPAATNRTAVALVGGTISSLVTSPMCLTGSPSSSISGHSGSNIQWQSTTDTNGVWNNVGTINSVNYTPISPLTQTTYIRAKEYCNTTIDSTNILSFKILNPSVSSVTLDTVCGNGVANLGVQIANSSSVKWYTTEFGNTVVDTNLNYNTPNISSSVTYYVSANTGGASTTSLPLNPSSVGTGATSTAPQYLTFSLSSEAQIISVDVFPTNIGTGSILIKNSTNTVTLHTIPFNNTSITNGTTPFKVFFNIVLPAGNYIMSQGST